MSARTAYEEWNIADVEARQAEARLGRSWQAYFDGKGAPPAEELLQDVSRLRAIANQRLRCPGSDRNRRCPR